LAESIEEVLVELLASVLAVSGGVIGSLTDFGPPTGPAPTKPSTYTPAQS
jgi:hypothetical protein